MLAIFIGLARNGQILEVFQVK